MIRMDVAALNAFLARDFGQIAADFRVEAVDEGGLLARLIAGPQHLRPGGTVSGPAMFALADVAIYLLILSRIGPVSLAVTTNASIDYLRKPAAGCDLLARTRLLKLGRSLAVADALICAEGDDRVLARASMTYAIPPQAG